MEKANLYTDAFLEPIDHILEKYGICSNRAFANFIKSHEVCINGKPVSDREEKADIEADKISVNEAALPNKKHLYLMMNKPVNFVCTTGDGWNKNVYSLIPEKYLKEAEEQKPGKLHSIGRLDIDSCGLLLFTTNGKFSNFVTRPETHISKTYYVELKTAVHPAEQEKYIKEFQTGLELEEFKKGKAFKTKPAALSFLSENQAEIRIEEGKFRQIRRMFSKMGNEVVLLRRTGCGKLKLPEDLKEGEVRAFGREALF